MSNHSLETTPSNPLFPTAPFAALSPPPFTSLESASLSSSSVRLGLWNANGLSASTIHDILRLCSSTHVVFITETWLLPSSGRLNTSWSQFHTYGVPVEGSYRGSQGVSALVSPSCPVPVVQVPLNSKYALGLRVGRSLHVICLYLPPTLPSDEVLQVLESLPLLEDTILCGDLNARLGDLVGDSATNPRGSLLRSWCEDRCLDILNCSLAHGEYTYFTSRQNSEYHSIVDYFVTNISSIQSSPSSSITVDRDFSLGSDHRLLSLSFDYDLAGSDPSLPPPGRRIWNLSRLRESEVRDLYVDSFSAQVAPLRDHLQVLVESPPASCPPIDALNDTLLESIYTSLDRSVGQRTHRPSSTWKRFWSLDLQALADKRDSCYRRWRRSEGLDKIGWWDLHQQAALEFRRAVRRAKRRSWREFCSSLLKDYTKTTSKIKGIRDRRNRSATFVHPDGPAVASQVMADHLGTVYSGYVLPEVRPAPVPAYDAERPFPIDSVISFDAEDIAVNILRLAKKKAPGPDHIRAEMLRPLREVLAPVLLSLFHLCAQWSFVPSLWRQAQVVPIFKKGDRSLASNYRPISLTSVFRKLFEICLTPQVTACSPLLDVSQGGFRPQRSALDQAVCLDDLIHHYRRSCRQYPVVAFLDIKAAYDTVDRRVIWNAMLSAPCSAPPALVALLANMFDDVHISVIVSNFVSHSFSPSTGVLQGSVLSPHLYSIYINTLPPLLRDAAAGSTARVFSVSPSSSSASLPVSSTEPSPTPINSLLYADDVAVIGSPSQVQRMMDLAAQHSHQLGYRWSPSKCAVLNAPLDRTITLYDEPVPEVDCFTYLGVPFRKNGISAADIIAHRQKGTLAAMAQLNSIGANRAGFALRLSARLYATFIRPKAEYGLAIIRLKKKESKALEAIQDKCLRMMYGGHPTSSTMVLRHMVNLPSMAFRSDTLITKFCWRAAYLPADCLLSLLSDVVSSPRLDHLRTVPMYLECPGGFNSDPLEREWLRTYRQDLFTQFVASTDRKLIKACRPKLRIDPVLYLPASRPDRSRLARWRMGWLPGKPKPCECSRLVMTSRHHLPHCPSIPLPYIKALFRPFHPDVNIIDVHLNLLPLKSSDPCPASWLYLMLILQRFDRICNPEGDYSTDPPPGMVWIEREQRQSFSDSASPASSTSLRTAT